MLFFLFNQIYQFIYINVNSFKIPNKQHFAKWIKIRLTGNAVWYAFAAFQKSVFACVWSINWNHVLRLKGGRPTEDICIERGKVQTIWWPKISRSRGGVQQQQQIPLHISITDHVHIVTGSSRIRIRSMGTKVQVLNLYRTSILSESV